MTDRPEDLNPLLRRLAGQRILARLVLLFESIWPALWPPLGVAGLFLCAALLQLPQMLPPAWHLTVLGGTLAAIFALALRGLWPIRTPDDAAADRRLERDSGLAHRPLQVLTDHPAQQDPIGLALWQAHVVRTIRQVRRLRVGTPRPGLARRDRYALRGGLVVGLIATFGIAGADAPARIALALEPTLPRLEVPPSTELQAWITPPAYTQVAPVFLRQDGGSVAVPTGSHLTVSVTGGSGTPSLSLQGHGTPFRRLASDSFQADRDLDQGGRLEVRRNGGELANWDLTVIVDQPPTAAWAAPPGPTRTGQETRLPWQTGDDYGVVSLQADLRLKDRPSAPALVVPIPLPDGAPKSAHGIYQQDLTASPWAGLPVTGHLVARDAPGQTGRSADATFILPERLFTNPIARILIAIRKHLSLHPEDRDRAVDALDGLIMHPELLHGDIGAYVNLGALYYLLEYDKSAKAIPEAQRQMWELALHLEDGQTEQTARELEQARQAARDALNRAMKHPTEANRQALEKRLQELQQAIERHMQALLQEARRDHEELPFDPDAQHLTNQDFQRMARQAEQAARQGDMNQAQQRMAELERMLDELRNARMANSKSMQQRAQQRSRGRQQMGALQDLIRRQGGLLDHAQNRADDQTRPQYGDEAATQPADPNLQREADQRVQQALRRALGELMQDFSDLTGKLPQGLGDADQAMQQAGRQLGKGDDRAASTDQQNAIEDLQKGGQQMGQTMAQQFGTGQQGEEGEAEGGSESGQFMLQEGNGEGNGNDTMPGSEGHGRGRRDPLGRQYGEGGSGADEGNDVTIPEKREYSRTREIEEELRQRDAQRDRPQQELDYYGRLLKGF
ncbi:MAG TPA: DUF4175 family protein [Acetobacteraceae bacterium]|nr:DUF4175 family protein [Acetobacteraceae bacterium]